LVSELNIGDIEEIAIGATILGAGGGGDPTIGMYVAQQAIRDHGTVTLITLDEVPDDAWLIPPAGVGAPTVGIEKLPAGTEIETAFRALEKYMNIRAFATFSSEVGGSNSLVPVAAAAILGIPLVDADMMGRAFPEIQMTTGTLFGISAWPLSMADERGNRVVMETMNNLWTERLARVLTARMGGRSIVCNYAMQGKDAKRALIAGSMTLARTIGRTLQQCRQNKQDPIAALLRLLSAHLVTRGKIHDVQRRTDRGFALGEVHITGTGAHAGEQIRIAFQNENLIVWKNQAAIVTVPDLICILDEATGTAITTERLRYGQRVAVLGIPCDEKWRTPEGVELAGPRYFKYDVDYRPLEAARYD
jgi:DUF917 family protein